MRTPMAAAAAALALAVLVSAVWAGPRAAQVEEATLTPVWGDLYRLSARARAGKGMITAAEYRVRAETGPLFAADGLLDGVEEELETYVDLSAGGPVAIRVRSGGAWSDWIEVKGTEGGRAATEGCSLTSAVAAGATWHRGPVTVDCGPVIAAQGAETVQFSLGFGDWQAAGEGFEIQEEGVHWVQVRTVDADGTPGLPSTFRVAIDATPPRVSVLVPRTLKLSHADQLHLDIQAEDTTSGVARVAAELNGENEIASGRSIDLWDLPLGEHFLQVYAEDHAGNGAYLPEPVTLTITTDVPTLARMIQAFSVRGRLDGYSGLRRDLLKRLEQVQAAQMAGETLEVRAGLMEFVEAVGQGEAEGLIFPDAARILIEDATAILESADEDPLTEEPVWGDN